MTTWLFEPTSPPTASHRGADPSEDIDSVPPSPGVGSGGRAEPTADQPLRAVELEELTPSTFPEASGVEEAGPAPSGIEAELQQAREEGWLAGIEEGRRLESERLGRAVESVKGLVSGIESAAAAREQEARARIVVLATAIATHLLEREVRASPDVISDLTRRAIAEFPVRDVLKVHLNPSDLALLSGGGDPDSGRAHLTTGQQVRWVPDPGIGSGGCLVEGADRIVDARISSTVERICKVLIDV